MAGYGWDEYDIRKGGRETIHDAGNTLDLTIDFVKVPGGQHGGNWAARIKGVPREEGSDEQITTVVFYATLEGLGNIGVATDSDGRGFEGDVKFTGNTLDLGDFSLDVTAGPETNEHPFYDHPSYEDKPLDRSIVSSLFLEAQLLWQSKRCPLFSIPVPYEASADRIPVILFSQLKSQVEGYVEKYGQTNPPPPAQVFTIKNEPGDGNVHLVEKVFKGPFEV